MAAADDPLEQGRRLRPGAVPADLVVLCQNLVGPVPQGFEQDRFVFSREEGIFVLDLTQVIPIVGQPVEVGLIPEGGAGLVVDPSRLNQVRSGYSSGNREIASLMSSNAESV